MSEVYGYLFDGPGVGKTSFSPKEWSKPWVLSAENENNPVSIPNNVFKNFGRQDIIVLDFLYRSYLKQLNGIILNEEEDLNPQLQVSSFLGALYKNLRNKFLVLILCPDDIVVKWHYYFSQIGIFEVKTVSPTIVPEDFDQEAGIVLILSFTNIKLAEYLKEYDFFSVVIDNFDEVATKLVIRKLQGTFNIGVTSRNFYVNPNQKVQWTMLNWANPRCVGKLADFYEIDDDNFTNFRDNYKEWWFRLTWNFCDSFVKPTLEEKGNLNKILKDYGITHNLVAHQLKNQSKPSTRKRKDKGNLEIKEEQGESKDNGHNKRAKKVYNNKTSKSLKKIPYKNTSKNTNTKSKQSFRNLNFSSDSSDSSDTIIYENSLNIDQGNEAMDSSDSDKPPIGGLLENNQVSSEDRQLEQEKNDIHETIDNKQHNEDQSEDDNDSVSSGEQLLCSLVRTKNKKVPKNTKIATKNHENYSVNFDEADLFLKSVATTHSDLSPLKNRQNTEKFFDKILEKSDVKPVSQMEIELTDKEVIDVPSESDSFFKGIFKKNRINDLNDSCAKETMDCGESSTNGNLSNGHVDVDTLVAEVMKMVGEK